MPWVRHMLVLLAVLAAGARAAGAEISVRASVDRTQAAVGETIVLTVEASGAQNVPAPEIGDLAAFHAQYLGPSTQISIVGGQVSASVSHRYALTARQAGQFSLGPFGVEYGGQRYEAPAVAVQIVPASAAQRRADQREADRTELRLVVEPAKTEPYVGERVALVVKLYVGNVRVDQLQYPQIGGEGFALEGFPEPTQQDEIVGGRRYRAVRFQTTLAPLRAGTLALGPASMGMSMLSQRRRGAFNDPFFDQFLGGGLAERRPIEVRAEAVVLSVRALPEAGRPAGFSGAVGQFDFSLTARPTELNAGDPITVQMRISGAGNLATVSAPTVPVDERFRTYEALAVKDEEGRGARVFEQVVIPREPGISALPAVRFSFFDPEAGTYRTITRGPVALTVRAPPVVAGPPVVSPQQVEEPQRPPEQLGRDIVYIKDVPGGFRVRGAAFYWSWWFVAIQLLPVAVFTSLAAQVRRRERLAADPRLRRFRQAGREARRVLARLGRQPADGAGFYDDLAGAVGAYLGAKLDLPPGAVERDRVLERLSGNGANEDVQRQVQRFFDLVERVRYAPARAAASERPAALQLAREIVDCLERERRLASRLAAGALAILAVALVFGGGEGAKASGFLLRLVAPGAAGAETSPEDAAAATSARLDPHTAFFQGNAAYKAGRYAEAVREYERVVAGGLENGALYFNLGNAYFKGGRLGPAILNFERARRLLPRDPDVRANLAYARERARDPAPAPAVWKRFLFPLAYRSTTAETAFLTAILWFLLWAVLIARLLVARMRVGLGRTAWAAAALLLMAAASWGLRMAEVEMRRAAVVTAPGETPVRFEPSASGTEHFKVGEGTLLSVTGEREDWLQVRRGDGRRGWIPSLAVSEV